MCSVGLRRTIEILEVSFFLLISNVSAQVLIWIWCNLKLPLKASQACQIISMLGMSIGIRYKSFRCRCIFDPYGSLVQGEWVACDDWYMKAKILSDLEDVERGIRVYDSGAQLFEELTLWYNRVTQRVSAKDLMDRFKWLMVWMEKCGDALERCYRIFEQKLRSSVSADETTVYGRYWYVQEFKYNRMVEEISMIQKIVKCMIRIEAQRYEDDSSIQPRATQDKNESEGDSSFVPEAYFQLKLCLYQQQEYLFTTKVDAKQ